MPTILKQKTLIAFLVFALSPIMAISQADTSRLELLTLKDLLNVKVVTASKMSQGVGVAPATVIVVTKQQIRSRGYISLLDILYDLPDIKVEDKIYSGMRSTITVRGTEGSDKFIILLDGVAISSPSGEALPIMENYPIYLAEQIEIVYGPASALYGANAVSGVINIITKTPSSKKGIYVEGSSAGGSYGYNNHSLFLSKEIDKNVHFILAGQYAYDRGADYSRLFREDSLMNVSSYSTGTFNTIYGPMTPVTPVRSGRYEAPMKAYNIYAAARIHRFSISYFRNYTSIPTSFGANTLNTIFNKDVFMAQNVSVLSASYKKTFNQTTSSTTISSSNYNLQPGSNYRNLYTAMEPAYKYSTCSMVKMEEQLDHKLSEKMRLSAGIGYENYHAIPQSADLAAPVNPKDYIHGTYLGSESYYLPGGLEAQFYIIRYHNTGGYLQMQYNPSEKIHVTAGIRYDMNSRYGNSVNPRAGIVMQPSAKTTLKVLYGSAFLAPCPSNSYVQYGSFETQDSGKTYHSYFLHLPNPGLKPIRSHNLEISLQQYITDNLSMHLNGYYTGLTGLHEFADDNESTHLYNNMFRGIPVDYVEVFVNESEQKNYGGSFRVNLKHSAGTFRFNSYASLSYVNGVVYDPVVSLGENKRTEIDFISPFMFRLGTDLKNGKFTGSARLLVSGKQRLAGIRENSGPIARRKLLGGYSLLNLSIRYTPTTNLSFFTNITNVLNQHYRSVGLNMGIPDQNTEGLYGQPEDPIRLVAGIHFSF